MSPGYGAPPLSMAVVRSARSSDAPGSGGVQSPEFEVEIACVGGGGLAGGTASRGAGNGAAA